MQEESRLDAAALQGELRTMLYVLQVICKHQYLYVVCILTFVYKHILHLHYFSPACTYTSRSLSSPTFSPTFISTVTFTTKTTSTTANPTYFGRLHLLQHIIYIIFHRHLLIHQDLLLCLNPHVHLPIHLRLCLHLQLHLRLHPRLHLRLRQHYTSMYT